jgi:E3 ubiquitin-protein ligase HERC4
MTSFIFLEGVPIGRKSLPALEYSSLVSNMDRLATASNINNELRHFRETIASFSSVSVLNASFRLDSSTSNSKPAATFADNNALSVDLESVRRSYEVLESIGNEQLMWTLGRSTLLLSEHLKECPWDDVENLSVFLIVLENPLLLQPKSYHIAIERVLSGILALPKSCRMTLFSWLKSYSSEYFSRIITVLHGYLSFGFINTAINIDPTPAVLVLDSLYLCNLDSHIIPSSSFYLQNLHKHVNLHEEWTRYLTIIHNNQTKVFNYFSYPFVIDYEVKSAILRINFLQKQMQQSNNFRMRYLSQSPPFHAHGLPHGLAFYIKPGSSPSTADCYFELKVNRSNLLQDVLQQLEETIADDIQVLSLPLRAIFLDEEGVDQGGVKKELITLAIRELIHAAAILQPCGTNSSKFWFATQPSHDPPSCASTSPNPLYQHGSTDEREGSAPSKVPRREYSKSIHRRSKIELCYYLGVLMGLACYNDILIDLPLPSAIYKIMAGMSKDIGLEDLFDVDSTLARGLKQLLEYEDVSISDVFGINFTSSSNPLLDDAITKSAASSPRRAVSYVELKGDGSSIPVERYNRHEFVQLFVQWALYGSAKELVDSYLRGIQVLFVDPLISLCTHYEIEILLSGSKDIGDLSALRLRTKYTGDFHDEHPIINWFWVSCYPSYMSRHVLVLMSFHCRICSRT